MEVKSEGDFVVDEEDFRHGSIKRVEVSFSFFTKILFDSTGFASIQ